MTTIPDEQTRLSQPPAEQPPRPVDNRRLTWSNIAQTLFSAVLLGGLLHWRWGYVAGVGDHLVLSPLGQHWADPSKFANDWVIANAPQPHWFFDVVTWFGAVTGQLGLVYFLYWAAALIVFGAATVMLARRWAPQHPWVATGLVSVIGAVTPWWLLGTGSPMLAIALPGVLAGFLIYLTIAALLVGRYRLASIVAIVTAIVHVQQGGVVAVLLLAVAVLTLVRTKKLNWWLVGAAVACFAIMFVNLKVRPVAGNLDDFAQACQQLIPYHCEASSWPIWLILQGFALVGLALVTVLYFTRKTWPVWAVTLLLSAVGLTIGIAVDRYDVPTLGVLAQGLNIYRLDVLLLPFAAWGLLVPVFANIKPWQRLAMLVVVLPLAYGVADTKAYESAYALERPDGGPWMLLFAGVLVVATVWVSFGWRTKVLLPVGAVLMAAAIGLSMMANPQIKLKPFDLTFIPDDGIRTWGEAVQKAVPPGEQLLAHPLGLYIRMTTARGVVADCKNGPYGGPAWYDYQERIKALGGFEQCRSLDAGVFNQLPASHKSEVAKRYGANYYVIEKGQQSDIPELRKLGWKEVVAPLGPVDNYVFKAPWAK